MTLEEALQGLSAKAGDFELQMKGVAERDGRPTVIVQLIIFEDGRVRDIKEQEVFIGGDVSDLDRVATFARVHGDVLREVFRNARVKEIEVLMPHDLVFFQVLELKSAKEAPHFHKALMQKSRLGQLLPRV